MLDVVHAVHVLAELGAKTYIPTNAVGGLNLGYEVGDLMVIKSHYSLIPNPLMGREMNFKTIDGKDLLRFEPMCSAYDPQLRKIFLESSERMKINVHEGNYTAITGPSYETEMQSLFYRDVLKSDAVGMSVCPEVEVARNRGMKCLGVSCITDMVAQDGTNAASHEEVVKVLNSDKVREGTCKAFSNFFEEYARLNGKL
jgi:purine-nucleoside phosphorylase